MRGGVNTYAPRRRYKGRSVGPTGHPRGHTPGGNRQATAGFECGQPFAMATKALSGPKGVHKVQMKTGRIRHVDPRCGL